MNTISARGRFGARTIITATSAVALMAFSAVNTAHAQQTAAGEVEEIVVTGTRIIRDGYEAPTPTTVISAEAVQQAATPNVIDYLSTLPTFAGNFTPQTASQGVSGGTSGVSSVNLRNLGTSRTLVLMDGQRIVPSTVGGQVDVGMVPTQLISRVDIVTGGASAAYGSDAVAGVVNFVLDKKFTGIAGEASGGVTTYGDDRNWKIALTAGTPFANERGHFIISGMADSQDGVLVANRPWNTQGFGFINNPAYGTTAGLSTSVPSRLLLTQVGPAQASKGGIIISGPLKGIAFGKGGTPYQYDYGDLVSGGLMHGGEWAANDFHVDNGQTLEPQMSTQNLFARVSYQITDNIEAYGQMSWYHNRYFSNAFGVEDFGTESVPVTNAFLDPAIYARAVALGVTVLTMGSTNKDMGIVNLDNERWVNRNVVGFNGNFEAADTTWTWNAYYQLGLSRNSERARNSQIVPNYTKAIDSVRNASGAIVCRVNADSNPANDDPACVPWNPFGVGVNSDAARNYLLDTAYRYQHFIQDVTAASLSGDPFSTWAGPVSASLGIEHRFEKSVGINTPLDQAGLRRAGNYRPTFGSFTVTEGFVEAVVPLAKDVVWAKALDLNAAVRGTGYSTAGTVATWKVGATYNLVPDFTVRATRSRDIRAPNIGDLYNAGTVVINNVTDTTAGGNGASVPYTGITRGNPNLVPEVADTTGLGIVLQPQFFPGFQASVDYWNIDVTNAISSVTAQNVVDLCAQGNAAFCAAINNGSPLVHGTNQNTIFVQPFNLAEQIVRGLDMEAGYTLPLASVSSDWDGQVSLRGIGTHYIKNWQNTGLSRPTQTAGQNTGSFYVPSWRWTLSATYALNPVSVTYTARGVSAGTYNNDFVTCQSGCPVSVTPFITVNNNRIPGAVYQDLAVSYELAMGDKGSNAQVFLNIKNIWNKDAVMVGGNGNFAADTVTTNTGLYDSLGRVFRVGVRFKM